LLLGAVWICGTAYVGQADRTPVFVVAVEEVRPYGVADATVE
jgi:hypothetical protein